MKSILRYFGAGYSRVYYPNISTRLIHRNSFITNYTENGGYHRFAKFGDISRPHRLNCVRFPKAHFNQSRKPFFSFSTNILHQLSRQEKVFLMIIFLLCILIWMKKGDRKRFIKFATMTNLLDTSRPNTVSREYISFILEEMKNQKLPEKKHVIYILNEVLRQFREMESIIDVSVHQSTSTVESSSSKKGDESISVVGDTHGQYYDTLNLFKLNGFPSSKNRYIFNGDFVDRGVFSFENVFALLAFKAWNPKCIHLLRGNHETRMMNRKYGFEAEILNKYGDDDGEEVYELFQEVFDALPLCCLIDKKILVLHGGVGFEKAEDVTLEEIRKLNRFDLDFEVDRGNIAWDILWSDPCSDRHGRWTNWNRGSSCHYFGPDVAKKFMDRNGLDIIIRSHEWKSDGYEVLFDGRLVTIFSSPDYCDEYDNLGAYVRIGVKKGGKGHRLRFFQFNAVPHPKVRSYLKSDRWF